MVENSPWIDLVNDTVAPETCPNLDEIKEILAASLLEDYEESYRLQDVDRCLWNLERIRDANRKLRMALAKSLKQIEELERELWEYQIAVDSII